MKTTNNTEAAPNSETRYHDRAVYLETKNTDDGWGTFRRFDAANAKPTRFAIDFTCLDD